MSTVVLGYLFDLALRGAHRQLQLTISPRYEDDTAKAAPAVPEIRSPPAVVNGSSAIKTEEPASGAELNITGDHQEYKVEPEQDDDEIDFNLGNGNDHSAPAHQERDAHGPGIKEDG